MFSGAERRMSKLWTETGCFPFLPVFELSYTNHLLAQPQYTTPRH